MTERKVEVRNLVLRMQGNDQHRAARLAREIAARLSDNAPSFRHVQPGANIRLRVEAADGQSVSLLADRVTAAMRRQLQ
ncbi:MAG: hypothetical protein WD208_13545 [Dehalococcoidia bacterium]